MHIKKIVSQYRRDFRAIYVCEHCGLEKDGYGYDDNNFHKNVIPAMKCQNCNKSASESYVPRDTKYGAHEIV
jgi:ribosomal protein L37AE/L43A